ncbi:hypothetical protein LM13656_170094 [Listeria monocytogenes]|nr:hypothetical protein LM1000505_150112 [Listeria monocytogenes]CUK34543.1 hypothetical protein LM13656_170094 [Listeria monocytogenes]CUK35647.1 hypothetical protein LM500172_100203 [Listeria monocytogenes]CUK41908.1 hypothetical protein LM500190_100202 [Listeria monocytogenes]CUK59118.1 hypothetical protein LM600918_100199 [Listeria monocytogenes]
MFQKIPSLFVYRIIAYKRTKLGKKLILRNAHIQDKRYNIIEESELKEEFFCHTNQIQKKQCKKLKN